MGTAVQIESVLEKQKKRYALLTRIYELTDGNENKPLMLEPSDDITDAELVSIIDYLDGEGLVESLADNAPFVRMLHRGVVEMEQSVLNPSTATEHFAVPVIQHFHGSVGSVLTGDNAVAHVTQNIGDPQIADLLRQLRQHLIEDPDQTNESTELLDGLELEVRNPNPSKSRIKLYLKSLASFVGETGKNILVEIGTRVVSDQLGLPPKN